MKYFFTKETMIPLMVEMTYQDVANIQKLADVFLALETKPTSVCEGDIRRLRDEAVDAMSKAASATVFLRVVEVDQ